MSILSGSKPLTIPGSDPGSLFTVFAGDGKYLYGIRAWVAYVQDPVPRTFVAYRVRIVADPESGQDGVDIGRVLAEEYAKRGFTFTGRSPMHASTTGVLGTIGIHRKTAILGALDADYGGPAIYGSLAQVLFQGDPSSMILSKDKFTELLKIEAAKTALPDDPTLIQTKIEKLG